MKTTIILLSFFSVAELFSQVCTYSYTQTATSIQWTAYKFSEKTGVKGALKKFTASGQKQSGSIVESIRGLRFEIDSSSVDSANPERDAKISKFFFGNDKKANLIKGSFRNIKDGTAELVLVWNGVERGVPTKFKIQNKTDLELDVAIDTANWKMGKGLRALDSVCSELHKGKDGLSKVWPVVDVKITSKFDERCK